MAAEPVRVLISSAGRRVGLMDAFRDALAALGLQGELLAADISRTAPAFHKADRAFVIPRCTTDDFIPHMRDLCAREGVTLVVPTIDTELMAWAQARHDFAAAGTAVGVSAPDTIAIGGDKLRTHAWLTEQGFPTVGQARPEDVLEGRVGGERWRYPLLVKPIGGSSSIGVARVVDADDLRLKTRGGGYLVQTIAPGVEYTVSVFVDGQGRARCAVPRRRLEVRNGEVSKGMTVRLPALQDLALRIAEALPGAYGAMNVQIFAADGGGGAAAPTLSVIELNPRFGGGFPLAARAGANYAQWLLEDVLGLPSSARPDGWRDGLVMLRYDEAVYLSAQDAGLTTA